MVIMSYLSFCLLCYCDSTMTDHQLPATIIHNFITAVMCMHPHHGHRNLLVCGQVVRELIGNWGSFIKSGPLAIVRSTISMLMLGYLEMLPRKLIGTFIKYTHDCCYKIMCDGSWYIIREMKKTKIKPTIKNYMCSHIKEM